MTKYKDEEPIRTLLQGAAKQAGGKHALATRGKNGKIFCCFWGEAARMMGVRPSKMLYCESFLDVGGEVPGLVHGDFLDAPGSATWDDGGTEGAIEDACSELEDKTVGDFREFLESMHLLKPRKKS
jgi:hypothetical protein